MWGIRKQVVLRTGFALAFTSTLMAPAVAAAGGRTWINPLDIDYRYNYEQMNQGISYRTGADPAIVRYKGAYYLFLTLADGYWRSNDLVRWSFVKPDKWPFTGPVAPATLVADGKLFLMESAMGPRPLLYSTDPAHGRWHFWTRMLPRIPGAVAEGHEDRMKPGNLPPGPWDPGLFQDDDGKVYLYWDSSNVFPIYGAQLDLAFDKAAEGEGKRVRFLTRPLALLRADPAGHGWERFGLDHGDTSIAPYIEGSWMNRHDGRYYLQYAAPGTEYNVYATGVYVGKDPLGPFTYASYNPVGYKPGGFVVGAGHGSTFRDAYGNWWNTGTNWIGVNWKFERRIDLYPAGFNADGQMWVDTRFGDFPQRMPDHTLRPGESTFTGWMLLSYRKHATASSQLPGYPPSNAADENPRTFWVAANTDPGQTLTLDLGGLRTVRAVQVNYADYQSGRYGDAPDIVTQFRLEGSLDGKRWSTLADLSHSTRDHADAYVELAHAARIRLRALRARARRCAPPRDRGPARVRPCRRTATARAGAGVRQEARGCTRCADRVEAGARRGRLQRALGLGAGPTARVLPAFRRPADEVDADLAQQGRALRRRGRGVRRARRVETFACTGAGALSGRRVYTVTGFGLSGSSFHSLIARATSLRFQHASRSQRRYRGVCDPVAVDLEERAQVFAGVAAAETVGAEHDVALAIGHEGADLVGVFAHVVGGGHDRARHGRPGMRDVRHARFLVGRMQAVPALGIETVAAQLAEARARPDVRDHAEFLLQQLRRRDAFAQDRAGTKQLHARRAFLMPCRHRANRYMPLTMPSSQPSGMSGCG